jgi:hypothetical protein
MIFVQEVGELSSASGGTEPHTPVGQHRPGFSFASRRKPRWPQRIRQVIVFRMDRVKAIVTASSAIKYADELPRIQKSNMPWSM